MNFKTAITVMILATLASFNASAQQKQDTSVQQQSQNDEGPNVEIDEYHDWVLRCDNSDSGGTSSCLLFERLLKKDTNQLVLQASVALPKGAKKSPILIFTLPLGIYLPDGASLQVDGSKGVSLQINRCLKQGCIAVLSIQDALLGQLKNGKTATVSVSQSEGKTINFALSLDGFKAGFKALEEST